MTHALSDDIKKVRRFAKLDAEIKAREKERDALKEHFRTLAGGSDRRWADEKTGLVLTVNHETQTRLDSDRIRVELGAKIVGFEKVIDVTKVSVKKVEMVKPRRSAA